MELDRAFPRDSLGRLVWPPMARCTRIMTIRGLSPFRVRCFALTPLLEIARSCPTRPTAQVRYSRRPPALLVVPNVPEPSTIVLAVFGVMSLLALRGWRRKVTLAGAAAVLLGAPFSIQAALPPGDLVIGADIGASNNFDWGLLLIDPTTGNRTILSDNAVGSGPVFSGVVGITTAADGSLLVTAEGGIPNSQGVTSTGVLYRVDPSTGNRSIISSSSANSGPFSYYVEGRSFGSSILMSGGDIVSVDPATGNRTIVSGASRGSGDPIGTYGFSIVGTDLFVANASNGDIAKVDTLTGNRTVVSSASVGTGPGFVAHTVPFDVELGHSGNLLAIVVGASDSGGGAILSIDPSTGNRTLLSGLGLGT